MKGMLPKVDYIKAVQPIMDPTQQEKNRSELKLQSKRYTWKII